MSGEDRPRSGSDVPRMGTGTITRDEWLAEFERVLYHSPRPEDGWMTAREIGEAMVPSRSSRAVLARMYRYRDRILVGRKAITDLAGRETTTFCYKLRRDPE